MQYLKVEEGTDWIVGAVGRPDPGPRPPAEAFVGPIEPLQQPDPGFYLVDWQEPLNLSDCPSNTSRLKWSGQAPVWVETAPLANVTARAIDQIDGAASAARLAVISQQTNMPEYERAERHAREYKAAGYPVDDVPRAVAGWAAAKHRESWTARQAADDIIATADAWIGLLDDIRDLRLYAKEDVRYAADCEEVTARVEQFSNELTNLMKGYA
jgi:hypothetical protein